MRSETVPNAICASLRVSNDAPTKNLGNAVAGCRLPIVGGVGESRWCRRGCGKRACTRGSNRAPLVDPSTSPLGGNLNHSDSPSSLSNTPTRQNIMAKAYWVAAYHSIRDQEALAAYAKLAVPALRAAGGRLLARGLPARVYEKGIAERTVLIEFDSVAQAIAAHESAGYQEALRALGEGAERDLRIVEGLD